MPRFALTPRRALLTSVLFVFGWQAFAWGLPALGVRAYALSVDRLGWTGLFLIGLGWSVWLLERIAQYYEGRRLLAGLLRGGDNVDAALVSVGGEVARSRRRIWNPLDLAAWYYGRSGQRLKQSFLALDVYVLAFVLIYLVAHMVGPVAGVEPYELPAGGGQEMIRQTVQIRKVVRKKFVINPYSSIRFAPPPLDQIDVTLQEETRNEYQVGQGAEGDGPVGQGNGSGSGFGAGTGKGKVRFIRLRHADRAWDKNFGIGGDRNMLAEYAARTRRKVNDETEAIDIAQLGAFPHRKSPPLVYVAGAGKFSPSSSELRVLREYLLEKHGMILGDNIGGQGFHQQFITAMNAVTSTTPVPVPRDDRIHQAPYRLPNLPIVVAHGGTLPLGWKVDGRWVAYYHPGALSDAWRDDHAGIRKDIYEMCYQLGVNVIFYAHREYNTWLQSQQP